MTSANTQAPQDTTYLGRVAEKCDVRRTQKLLKGDGKIKRSETYHYDASAHLITSSFSLPLWASDYKEGKAPHAKRLQEDFPETKNKQMNNLNVFRGLISE